jgi:glucose uptake protein GlcU
MTAREFWSGVLAGIGGLIALAIIIGALFLTGQGNRAKEEQMGKTCITHGFQGWDGTRCTR